MPDFFAGSKSIFIFVFPKRDVAQPGSALRSGRRGRWFESSHPDRLQNPLFRGFCSLQEIFHLNRTVIKSCCAAYCFHTADQSGYRRNVVDRYPVIPVSKAEDLFQLNNMNAG